MSWSLEMYSNILKNVARDRGCPLPSLMLPLFVQWTDEITGGWAIHRHLANHPRQKIESMFVYSHEHKRWTSVFVYAMIYMDTDASFLGEDFAENSTPKKGTFHLAVPNRSLVISNQLGSFRKCNKVVFFAGEGPCCALYRRGLFPRI